jgi:formate hydrogenlyase subunit 4
LTGENLLIGNITGSDLFLIIYMFAMARLFTVLSALDAGSVFGGFGASREVTVALLVEPAIILALASLGCAAHTSDLNYVFSWVETSVNLVPLWFTSGIALYLASLIELSRMPADDPTTHLELTMVHEAMILENSGRNLALTEYTHLLKMTIMLGLSSQCFLHGLNDFFHFNHFWLGVLSLLFLLLLAASIGLLESTAVKLRWTKVPEFIAYAVAMSLLCSFIAIGVTS